MASEIINLSRLFGVCIGLYLLTKLGRKTLLLISQSVILAGLLTAWYLETFLKESDLTIIGIIVVLIGF